MKVYIVLENLDGFGAVPPDMDDLLIEVFVTERQAEEFMRETMRHFHSVERQELILDQKIAKDENGTIYYQIIERDINP